MIERPRRKRGQDESPRAEGIPAKTILLGILSDTHGLLRPEALDALRGVDHILHTGDIGDGVGGGAILDKLRAIAPVSAIRGNIDQHGPCARLPATEVVEFAGHSLYMLHDRNALDLDPVAAGFSAILSGHSHQPRIEWRGDVLYFNPGSAGPRRFSLPISLGLLTIHAGPLGQKRQTALEPQLIELG
jgi:uncharacterized protein